MKPLITLACSAVLSVAFATPAPAQSGGHGHGHGAAGKDASAGVGVLEAVRAGEGVVAITHEPIPELGWPKMTMELPVTRRVDLAGFKAGDRVEFELKKGRDDVYRIVNMKSAP